MKRKELINGYLDKYPNMAAHTLARIIYKENNLLFKNAEYVRSLIRIKKGASGKLSLKNLADTKYLSPEKLKEKYNIPEGIEIEYKPYNISCNNALIFSDVHIPFHDRKALTAMFEYCENKKIDAVILNGDITDCFDISHFNKEPNLIRIKDEIQMTKDFLIELKRVFPKAKIYFKFGNHEKRFEDYLKIKAPELYGLDQLKLETLLDLFNLGIQYVPEDVYINLHGLYILHGHEYKNGITSPANPARTAFLRTKSIAIMGHYHQTSEHSESRIDGDILACWSLGCLCSLHPKYMPLNKWGHGFALYTREDSKFWHVENKKIIKGRVV